MINIIRSNKATGSPVPAIRAASDGAIAKPRCGAKVRAPRDSAGDGGSRGVAEPGRSPDGTQCSSRPRRDGEGKRGGDYATPQFFVARRGTCGASRRILSRLPTAGRKRCTDLGSDLTQNARLYDNTGQDEARVPLRLHFLFLSEERED